MLNQVPMACAIYVLSVLSGSPAFIAHCRRRWVHPSGTPTESQPANDSRVRYATRVLDEPPQRLVKDPGDGFRCGACDFLAASHGLAGMNPAVALRYRAKHVLRHGLISYTPAGVKECKEYRFGTILEIQNLTAEGNLKKVCKGRNFRCL
jgi:hypothetical protein